MAYTIKGVNKSIADTIATVSVIKRVEDLMDLELNITNPDAPLAQVYPDGWGQTSDDSGTQIITFGGGSGGGLVHHSWDYVIDVYIDRMTRFAESMVLWAEVAQAVIDKIDDQNSPSPFGNANIKSFQYSGERVTIKYSGEDWLVCRITITVSLF